MTVAAGTQKFSREAELTEPVRRFLRNRKFRHQDEEVPFYEYRMDLYGYSERDDLTVAVELKLTRWSKAFQQALRYQLCSDLVYIAMPAPTIGRVDQDLLAAHGVGLIAVTPRRCWEVLPAERSKVLRDVYRKDYIGMVQEETK